MISVFIIFCCCFLVYYPTLVISRSVNVSKAKQLYETASKHVETGDLATAKYYLEQAINEDSENVNVNQLLGTILLTIFANLKHVNTDYLQ